jgi:cyclophilin family peptidyl-prolyl cis-trans isomerase
MKRTWKATGSAGWVFLLATLLIAVGCEGGGESPTAADVAAEQAKKEAMEKKKEPEPLTGKHVVIMETTKGTVKMELDADKAPKTVENFVAYMDRRFYDGTIFHRVVKRFMVQGGGFTFDLKRKMNRGSIENESDNGLKNLKGAVSMARGKDPQSATTQFFINLKNNSSLDRGHPKGDGTGYCVFGKVIEGMEVIEEIGKVKTTEQRSRKNVPVVPVFIKSIWRAPPAEAEMSE